MTLTNILILLAVLIILVLAVVAGVMQYKVVQLNRARKDAEAERDANKVAQRGRINKSIQVIAQSVGTDDITLTEASIRISVLLDSLSVEDSVREEFSAFYELAESTGHIPILDAWKELPTKKKLQYDRERTTQEQFHEKGVLDAAKRIRGRDF